MSAIRKAIDIAARMVNRKPTDGQKDAGNYAKGHVRIHGLDVAIENPKGGSRSGVDKGGKAWKVTMPAHYGYVKGTEGKDGDHVDVYIGPEPDAPAVFVVDQVDADSGRFDEHKCMLGFRDQTSAVAAYKKAFSDGRGGDRISGVTKMSIPAFKAWLRSGKTKKPLSAESGKYVENSGDRAMSRYANGGAVTFRDQSVTVSPIEEALRGYADGGEIMPWERPSPGEYDIRRDRIAPPDGPEIIRERPPWYEEGVAGDIFKYGPIPAKAMWDQPGAAGRAAFKAWDDPTRENLVDAGIQNALMLFRPGLAGTVLATGLASTAAEDMGLSPFSSAKADPTDDRLARMSADQLASELAAVSRAARGMPAEDAIKIQKLVGLSGKDVDGQIGSVTEARIKDHADKIRRQMLVAGARDDAEASRKMELEKFRIEQEAKAKGAAGVAAATQEAKDKGEIERERLAEFNRQVRGAERARDAELALRRRFEDTETGKLWGKYGVLTPALLSAVVGGATRGSAALMGKSGKPLYEYGLPAGFGALTGAVAANYPLAHDIISAPAENPDKRAYEAYARELPAGHPRKDWWASYAKGLDRDNPTRVASTKEFYDPAKLLERSALGAVEGLVSGPLGAKAQNIAANSPRAALEGASKMPGRALEAFYEAMEGAAKARGKAYNAREVASGKVALTRQKSAQALADAQDAGSDAVRKALDVAEAQRRKALPPAGKGTPPPKGSRNGSGSGPQAGSEKTGGQRPRGGSGQNQTSEKPSLPAPKGTGSADAPNPQGAVLPGGVSVPSKKGASASAADDAVTATDPHGKYVDYDPSGRHGRVAHQLLTELVEGKPVIDANLVGAEARDALVKELMRRLNAAGTPVNPAGIPQMVDKTLDVIGAMEGKGALAKSFDEAIALARREPGTLMYAPGAIGGAALLSEGGDDPEVERRDGGPVPDVQPEPKVYLKTKNKSGRWQMRSEDGKYASGGAIGRAVSTARAYATGGAVHVGPVVGATGGRADELPVSVSEGAFVVPADIVSGLGEGNTLAGMEMLKKTFGPPGKPGAGGGSVVPIKISDGEFVISPEQVAKIGQGDVSRGHQILDQMIKKLRRQHIQQLSELPPPAK